MTTYCCPTCGAATESAMPVNSLADLQLGSVEREIVAALVSVFPRHMLTERLADRVYADHPDGGPETGGRSLQVTICRLRKRLQPYGWTIPKGRSGPGSPGYRLAMTEAV